MRPSVTSTSRPPTARVWPGWTRSRRRSNLSGWSRDRPRQAARHREGGRGGLSPCKSLAGFSCCRSSGMKYISCDCESTGVDLHFGAKPFLITTCNEQYQHVTAEWFVDPFTREPIIVEEERRQIQDVLDEAEVIFFHNSKFDVPMLAAIDINVTWKKTRCTFTADHLLGSNLPHNLTDVVMRCLGHDIGPLEGAVKKVTTDARKLAKTMFPDWKLAREGDPDMPSVKGNSDRDEDKPWKNDMWAARLIRAHFDPAGEHSDPTWETACREYADGDSAVTLPLGLWQERE